jgi:hypothetical protein
MLSQGPEIVPVPLVAVVAAVAVTLGVTVVVGVKVDVAVTLEVALALCVGLAAGDCPGRPTLRATAIPIAVTTITPSAPMSGPRRRCCITQVLQVRGHWIGA